MNPTRMPRWIAIGWIVVGLGSIAWTADLYYRDQAFARLAQSVKGTVISLENEGGDPSTYAPVVKFVTRTGETMQFKSSHSSAAPAYQVGDSVDVLYDPQNPNHAEISGAANVVYLMFVAFGFFFALFGGISLVWGFRR